GFRDAAENVEDPELKSTFNRYSLQRSQFAGELQSLAIQFGESDPEDSSSVAGALHRGWIDLKSAIVSRNAHAILEECERGEDSAVREYKDALSLNLPANLRDILQRQYADVEAAH